MNLIKITDLTNQFGLTSRSLRYYEQVGLIQSVRPRYEKYRFYDEANVERLKQIMVLRKMQIPIKDIIRIFESEDMSVLVQTFVQRIDAIDGEINALSEMKRIINEFLQAMSRKGIKKISALPLLYEEMDKQLNLLNTALSDEPRKPVTYEDLSELSERLEKPLDITIIDLPPMRVISSYLKANPQITDVEGFSRFAQAAGISPGHPGQHERLEFQTAAGDVEIRYIPDDYINGSIYLDYRFGGGLFAAANVYLDEDLGQRFRVLIKAFDDNKYYQIDYAGDGSLRHGAMLERLISPDDKRELVLLLVPVKKRSADSALFEKPKEIPPNAITIKEIEAQNPVLWTAEVPLDRLTPINNPHYRVLDNGEVEYVGWVIRSVLNTNISVKLPFRVDLEFRQTTGGGSGMVIYHSEDTGYTTGNIGKRGFGINMGNTPNQLVQAVSFHQPIFGDYYHYPKRGAVRANELNRLTWIVGEKHLALIINGEIRYCGAGFPYMSMDLSRESSYPIVIGSHGGNDLKYIRSIRVSQLAETKKSKLKEGELTMMTKQSNNMIPIIHRLVTDEYGENYWFNGCARYVMECLGEKDYDYWFFAGLTGDLFTQHYTYTKYSGDALSSYWMDERPAEFVEEVFAKIGYAATYVAKKEVVKNTEMYLQTLVGYIDKGIPVIVWDAGLVGVFVGYEGYGRILLYITGNNDQPERIPLEKALEENQAVSGWIFVGIKKESPSLAQLYRKAISAIPQNMSIKTETYCFGAEAFRVWARDIENGKFDGLTVEEFDTWSYYTNYVCVLSTNGCCSHEFLKRAYALNPDMAFLGEVGLLYKKTEEIWHNQNGENLEALGGGFNITLETLQNKDKRSRIAAKIRECGDVADEIVKIISSNLNS